MGSHYRTCIICLVINSFNYQTRNFIVDLIKHSCESHLSIHCTHGYLFDFSVAMTVQELLTDAETISCDKNGVTPLSVFALSSQESLLTPQEMFSLLKSTRNECLCSRIPKLELS